MISVSVECSPSNNLENSNSNSNVHIDVANQDEIYNSEPSMSPIIVGVSNRILYVNTEIAHSPGHGARDVLYTDDDMSPFSLSPEYNESVGDCGICYKKLPLQSNHIFTVCGHLFCVKCLFNWNNTSSTCPMCRKILYENITNLTTHTNSLFDNSFDNDLSSNEMSIEIVNSHDLIQWPDDPNEGDILINDISQRESTQLYEFRILSLDIFRRMLYIDSLFVNKKFTGQFTYEFIPRNHYIYLNVSSEHLYEFVIRKNTLDDYIDEINFLGYILEFNCYEPDDYLLINVINPRFIVDQLNYDIDTNTIDFSRLIFKFSNVRRLYSVCPVYEQ
jgi:hypothetical protein